MEGTKAIIHQLFESPDDEALRFGTASGGRFQLQGKNESLFPVQYQSIGALVVSNKNYGMLWDNYSLSKFGDVRDYADLDQFRLYGSDGSEGGLTAVYAKKMILSNDCTEEPKLDYQFVAAAQFSGEFRPERLAGGLER